MPCEGVGRPGAGVGKEQGTGLGMRQELPAPGAVNETPPASHGPRPRPRPVPSRRGSPAAAPPPPWRSSGRSAPPLHHSGSGSPDPSAKTLKLETSREAAWKPQDPAPPPEVRGPSEDLGSELPLGRARSARGTPLLTRGHSASPRIRRSAGFGIQRPLFRGLSSGSV